MTSWVRRVWTVFGALSAVTLYAVVRVGPYHCFSCLDKPHITRRDRADLRILINTQMEYNPDITHSSTDSTARGGKTHHSPGDQVRCHMEERIALLRYQCRNASRQASPKRLGRYWRLLVDDNSEVLYCVVPKAASTTLKTTIATASRARAGRTFHGNVHDTSFGGLEYMTSKNFNKSEIQRRLANYTKVIVVRHPFERLYSTYRNKFMGKRYYATDTPMSRIIGAYYGREYTLPDDNPKHKVMTFTQFLELLIELYADFDGYKFTDRHWMSYQNLCLPCEVHYDLVLKLETMDDDFPIFSSLVYKGLPHDNHSNVHLGSNTTYSAQGGRLHAGVSGEWVDDINNLPAHMFERLWEIYGSDFERFGYTWPPEANPDSVCTNNQANKTSCC